MTVDIDIDFRDYYVEELYMKADVETGVLYNRAGRRMIALTDDFLIGLHLALEKECGVRANEVLNRCGRRWGVNFAQSLAIEWSEFYKTPFKSFPLALFQSLLTQEFAHNGWGLLNIDYEHFAAGVVQLSLEGAVMAAIRPSQTESMSDELTAGILAGMYSCFLGVDAGCLQSQCAARGFSESRFLISSTTRIAGISTIRNPEATHPELLAKLLECSEA